MDHYIYIITNLTNKKQYIGEHSSNTEDEYMGSGLLIKKALKKYGRKNFKKEILEFFPSKKEAFDSQGRYIKQCNTLVPNGYNIDKNGGTRPSLEFINEKISNKNKGIKRNEDSKKKLSQIMTGEKNPMYKHVYLSETLLKMSNNNRGINNPMYGKKQKNESKLKIGKANKGRIKTEEERQKLSISHRGKKLNEESKRKISEKIKGTKLSEETKLKMSKPKSEIHRKNMSLAQKGRIFSNETKLKISKKIKDIEKIKCENCGKEFYPWHYSRSHGINCKLLKSSII